MMNTTVIPSVAPSNEQLLQTRNKIDAYIQSIDANPKHRAGAYPYYRFHEAGEQIRGTVIIFHGFSAKPEQMWRLADYLFQNGFNFYQVTLAGHAFVPPATESQQINIKPEILNPLREKVKKDPVLKNFFANIASQSGEIKSLVIYSKLAWFLGWVQD